MFPFPDPKKMVTFKKEIECWSNQVKTCLGTGLMKIFHGNRFSVFLHFSYPITNDLLHKYLSGSEKVNYTIGILVNSPVLEAPCPY